MVEPRGDGGQTTSIDNPILNSPYEQPDRHYEVGPNGPTGVIKDGRRPSESFIPIAVTKKGKKGEPVQETIDFDVTGERRERNEPDQRHPAGRREVASRRSVRRRHADHPQAAPALGRPGPREPRHLRPARGGRDGDLPHRGRGPAPRVRRLAQAARARERGSQRRASASRAEDGDRDPARPSSWRCSSPGRPSTRCSRRATRASPTGSSSSRPGITIRDRLRVLLPEDAENYYDLRDLIPADLKGGLEHARIVITNYHAFLLKDAKEIKGVAKNTRLLLKGDRKDDPFKETPQADGEPRPARPRAGQAADHGAQRRGAPLLPGQAARRPARRPTRSRQERERAGARLVPRPPGDRASTSGSSRSATSRRRRSTSRAPATTRATSSRGRSATSR